MMEMKWLQLVSFASALLGNSMWVPPPTTQAASSATTKLEIQLPISRFVSDLAKHAEICVWQCRRPMLEADHAFHRDLQLTEVNYIKKWKRQWKVIWGGMHKKKLVQQVKEGDFPPPLCSHETLIEVLCSALVFPAQDRHGLVRSDPEENHENF